MPSLSTSLHSVFFKLYQKHKLNSLSQCYSSNKVDAFGVTSRYEEQIVAANPTFVDGVATKDLHIDLFSSVSVRIFLPDSVVSVSKSSTMLDQVRRFDGDSKTMLPELKNFDGDSNTMLAKMKNFGGDSETMLAELKNFGGDSDTMLAELKNFDGDSETMLAKMKNFDGDSETMLAKMKNLDTQSADLRSSNAISYTKFAGLKDSDNNLSAQLMKSKDFNGNVVYGGYLPCASEGQRKLPVILQFHEGGFVSGSNVSVENDLFCRRMAKLCDVIVVAVGYRLAPESKYPAAFEDGVKVLNWLAKQANLAECGRMVGNARGNGRNVGTSAANDNVLDSFGVVMLEPWLAAHGDLSRFALIGVSCGANIANYVARKAIEAGRVLDPVKVVAQVLMYPFFAGSIPTKSDIKLANTYFYDKTLCMIAWKLFLPEEIFNLDHPAANPLSPGAGGVAALKRMPPTLTIVGEHDWMRDRAIAYSEELRKLNVDAPVLDYKDAVHGFATLDTFLQTPEARACAEDIAIWVKKYISLRGHEFSY